MPQKTMKRLIVSFAAALFLAGLAACSGYFGQGYTGAKKMDAPYTHTFPTSYKATWDALVNSLVEDLRLNLSQLDEKNGRVVLSEDVIPIGRYCDCRGLEGTALRRVEIRLKHLGKEGSRLTIDARYSSEIELKNNLGQVVKKRKIECASTGRLEEEIVWHMKGRLDL